MEINTEGENITAKLPSGSVFAIGIRGEDKLVVSKKDKYGHTENTNLSAYFDGEGEKEIDSVRHVVLN